ncbi:hypothetical protein APUTEX25_000323, partial [Auxenochlorella protothecoides]
LMFAPRVKVAGRCAGRGARKTGVSLFPRRQAPMTITSALGDSLEEYLQTATSDPNLRRLMTAMSEAIRTIAYKVRTASCSSTACINTFGDEQLAVDLLADKLLFEALRYSHACKYACSEENPEPLDVGGEGFSVAFDPLDGSSIVDTNFSVGTIFGVWPGDKLKDITGRQQAAAGMGIYGPRTVYCIALAEAPGCQEFLLQDDGKWLHIIVKEQGVFTNVISPTTKAKLRILFEVAPLALLVEKAGGHSSADGKCISGLDVEIKQYDQRTQICFGSIKEVARFEKMLYGKSERFAKEEQLVA